MELTPQMLIGATAAIGVGVFAMFLAFVVGRKQTTGSGDSVQDQIAAYGAKADAARRAGRMTTKKPKEQSLSDSAKAKAAAALANSKGLEVKIAKQLDGAGSSLKPAEWLLAHAGIAMVSALVLLVVGHGNPLFAVLGLLLGVFAPWKFLGFKRGRRIKAFQAALPDTLQLMAGSLQAGLSLAQSVDTIVREGGEPLTSEFRRVVIESRLGVALEDAMEGVGVRMDSRDFEWVVMAIRIQREVGGNLAELLLNVAGTLREREYIRRHVRALSAEGRLSCYVLGGLPPAFLGYLALSKWDYVKPLFTTPIGFVLVGGMSVLLGVGVIWMSKVSKVNL